MLQFPHISLCEELRQTTGKAGLVFLSASYAAGLFISVLFMCQLSQMPLKPFPGQPEDGWPESDLLSDPRQVYCTKTFNSQLKQSVKSQQRKLLANKLESITRLWCSTLFLLTFGCFGYCQKTKFLHISTTWDGSRFSKFYVITSKFLLCKKSFVLSYDHKCDQSDFLPICNLYLTFSWQSEQIFRYFHPQ